MTSLSEISGITKKDPPEIKMGEMIHKKVSIILVKEKHTLDSVLAVL
jgi:hypothetical protein